MELPPQLDVTFHVCLVALLFHVCGYFFWGVPAVEEYLKYSKKYPPFQDFCDYEPNIKHLYMYTYIAPFDNSQTLFITFIIFG